MKYVYVTIVVVCWLLASVPAQAQFCISNDAVADEICRLIRTIEEHERRRRLFP